MGKGGVYSFFGFILWKNQNGHKKGAVDKMIPHFVTAPAVFIMLQHNVIDNSQD